MSLSQLTKTPAVTVHLTPETWYHQSSSPSSNRFDVYPPTIITPHKTSILINSKCLPLHLVIIFHFVLWLMFFVCLHLVQLLMCVVNIYFWELLIFFCTYLLITPFFFVLGDPHPQIHTNPPTLRGICAAAHRVTPKCWCVVCGVVWTTFIDPPCDSDFILVTQVRAIMCGLLILFIAQSGSCTLRPPRLFLCCFLSHRRQISSDIPFTSFK